MRRQADHGFTFVEVLVATAVATTVLAAAAGLLGVSSRAVFEGELETTATWLASRTVEEWRASTTMAADGVRAFDREGREVGAGAGSVFLVQWSAQVDSGRLWRVSASVTTPRLSGATTVTALIVKAPL